MKFLRTLLLSFSLLSASTLSQASVITFTDVYDPADVYLNSSAGPAPDLTFTHSILTQGFNSLTDTLTSITILLNFMDDADRASEAVKIVLDSSSAGTYTVTSGSAVYTATVTALPSSMQTDGLLVVDLKATSGDFYFLSSTLTAEATRTSALLPSPGLASLFGVGLLSLVFVSRKRAAQ